MPDIIILPTAEKTYNAVTAIQLYNYLLVFWRDELGNIHYSRTMDGTTWSPSGNSRIGETTKSPFATVFNDKIYIFWKSNDPSNLIYYSQSLFLFSGRLDTEWSGERVINTVDTTAEAVTAVQFYNSLFIFWRDELDNIRFSRTLDGTTWESSDSIGTLGKTAKSPFAAVFKEKLYVFWKSNDPSNHIYCSRSDAAHGLRSGRAEWAPSTHLINTFDTTPEAVTAVAFHDGLYVFWKSNDPSNRIYWSRSEDGVSWPPGEVLKFHGETYTTPKSPFATVFNDKIYIFWIQKDPVLGECCSDIYYNGIC